MTIDAAFDVPSTDLYFQVIDTVRERHEMRIRSSTRLRVNRSSTVRIISSLEVERDDWRARYEAVK